MAQGRSISEAIKDLEHQLATQKAVQAEFPNAKIHYASGFQSKEINQRYTKFEFEKRRYGLWVIPFCEVSFEYDGKTEIVKVYSAPKANRLVYISWSRDLANYVIKFARLSINMKNNEFREDMLNSCRVEIMSSSRIIQSTSWIKSI